MNHIADYLDITIEQSLVQWHAILGRPPRPTTPGFRQVPFTPTETLLCLAAMLVVDHHHFGGSTNQLAPSPVPELAALFARTPGSILAKQANLDGSRPNGALYEVATAETLLGDVNYLVATYLVILEAARVAGVTDELLPDFLSLEVGRGLTLLGQDELVGEDIRGAVAPRLAKLAGHMGEASEEATERLLVSAARVGQHRFAANVLANFSQSCGFCGMRPGPRLAHRGLLVASHIKPWRNSSDTERLDPTNGIAACPTHDAAFDRGLIWVNGGYRIHLAKELSTDVLAHPGMSAAFGRPPIADILILPATSTPPNRKYLDWHRQNVATA